MFFIILFCLAPGSSSLTYNGKDSKAILRLGVVRNRTLSFSLRTRQSESFLFAAYESGSRYFVVGIKGGNLSLKCNYSGNVYSVVGPTIGDGARHDVEMTHNLGKAAITVDNFTLSSNTDILSSDWMNLFSNRSLVIGSYESLSIKDLSPSIKDLFTNNLFGCLSIKKIGQIIPTDGDYNKTKTKNDCVSSNPCNVTGSPCDQGTCTDTFNDYACKCSSFYTGRNCNETMDVSCSFGNICNNGTCAVLNETTAVTKVLSNNGRDFFKCNCLAGYQGYLCKSVTNECSPNNCKNGAQCVDGHLQYSCKCTDGWIGKNCSQNKDDCSPNPCQNKGVCMDLLNDYNCTCYQGKYTGKNCSSDVNECELKSPVCMNDGKCTNTFGGFNCACAAGYFGDTCQYNSTTYCARASPCGNHGTCLVNGSSYSCKCEQGYEGKHCKVDYNECAQLKPCMNNATCADSHTRNLTVIVQGYNCTCTDQFEGKTCNKEKNPCDVGHCHNGGNCTIISYKKFKCTCTSGYTGDTCLTAKSTGSKNKDTTIIIIIVVVVVVVVILIILLVICYVRKNSGQTGTYKPNAEEITVGTVPLEPLKKPNIERLI